MSSSAAPGGGGKDACVYRTAQTTDDAADSIQSLYDYLTSLDAEGRYVYRGQTREYDAPLLPSAFRPILNADHGVAVRRTGRFRGFT
jgi:hypothetical protein